MGVVIGKIDKPRLNKRR